MPIEFRCTDCNKLLRTKDESAGKQAKCPECGKRLTVPIATPAPDIASPPGDNYNPTDYLPANPYAAPQAGNIRGQMSATAAGQLAPTPIEFGDMFRRTWAIFRRNLGICILLNLVVGAAIGAAFLTGMLVVGVAFFTTGSFLVGGLTAVLIVFGVFYLILSLAAGIHHCLLNIARGNETSLRELFNARQWVMPLFLSGIMVNALVGLGNLLIFGGIFAFLCLWPHQYLIIDRNMGAVDSIGEAIRITSGNRLTVLLILLVGAIAAAAFMP